MSNDVVVVGAGVSGLTTALVLRERGLRVKIVSATRSPATTSDVAAAIWHPFLALPRDRVLGWAKASLTRFRALYAVPEAGVSELLLTEYVRDDTTKLWWGEIVDDVEAVPSPELPEGVTAAFRVRVPLAESTRYLAYLTGCLERVGVSLEARRITSLSSLFADAALVVNCTGLGASELAADPEVYPIRGQVLRTMAYGVSGAHIDDSIADRPTYVIPRAGDCVVGGTADDEEWNLRVSDDTTRDILSRASGLLPVARFELLESKVGLRPGRSNVRLELERTSAGAIVHNYGHSGSGFTLSWGCAEAVADIAQVALSARSLHEPGHIVGGANP